MLLLLACSSPAPPCPEPWTEAWTPAIEEEIRLNEGDAVWTLEGGLEQDSSGCASDPCLHLSGAGLARLKQVLNRGEPYTLQGRIAGAGTLTVVEVRGEVESTLVSHVVDGLDYEDFSYEFSPQKPESYTELRLELDGGELWLDDYQLSDTWWAWGDGGGEGLLQLGFLIHIEDDVRLTNDEAQWRRRARVFEGLTSTLWAHGARLTIQPEASFIEGAALFEPGWLDARAAEGAGWSVHLHDAGSEEQSVRNTRVAFAEQGYGVSDVNGGFVNALWSTFAATGMRSLTAYKNATTQQGLPYAFVQPWRPPDGAGDSDIDAFMTHDPVGPLVYLPGGGDREQDHARFGEYAARTLSQVLPHTRDDRVNTWYFVLHIDDFSPGTDDDAALDAYLSDGSFDADLAFYDAFLTEVTDPLVDAGRVRYATPWEMADLWLGQEAGCVD